MRIAIVGAGRIGTSHAEVVRDAAEVDEVLLTDADIDRARAAADELGVKAGSVDDAFDGTDAVLITASTAAHPQLLVRALEAGLPAFCEKPVAPDLDGHRVVLDAAERATAPVQIGFQRRFDAGYTAARTALHDGRLGGLRRAHLVTADQAPPPAAYIPLSGGFFRDCSIHDFDVLRWVTGREVVEVTAYGTNRGAAYFSEGGDVDEAAGLLVLDDGTLVTFQGSRYNGAGHDIRMELAGTDATWVVGLSDRTPATSAEVGVDFPGGEPWPNYWVRFFPAYVAEVRAFLQVAQGRRESPCTLHDAAEAFAIAEAATRSWREHRTVRVDEVRP